MKEYNFMDKREIPETKAFSEFLALCEKAQEARHKAEAELIDLRIELTHWKLMATIAAVMFIGTLLTIPLACNFFTK